MPDIEELLKTRNKGKFSKKSYRPWDLSGQTDSSQEDSLDNNIVTIKPVRKTKDNTLDTNIEINEISIKEQEKNLLETNMVSNKYQLDICQGIPEESYGYHLDIKNSTANINKIPQDTFVENILNEKIGGHDFDQTEQEIIRLSGIQRTIFEMIMEICNTKNTLETGPVQTSTLAQLAGTTPGTIKISLKRLIDKNLVIRNKGKNAKNGYINLGIHRHILDLGNTLNKIPKIDLFASDLILKKRYQKDIIQETYNSNNYINTTNKTYVDIPDDWENINIEPLAHIGFSKTQLKQLVGKNDCNVVQSSIDHFAYALENNPNTKKYEDPLNVLMGVLRKGMCWTEADFRSPLEIAQEKLLEAKRAESARKKKLEEDAFKMAMEEWKERLSEEEMEKYSARKKGDFTPVSAKLTLYFRENVWDSVRSDYLLF